MHEHDDISVEVSPFQAQGVLSGFLVSGRWPASTVEWVSRAIGFCPETVMKPAQ